MAFPSDNGDLSRITRLGKVVLPGAGFTLNGVAKRKAMVWGDMKGLWADTSGLKLSNRGGAAALGLGSIDYISFEVKFTGAAGTTAQSDESTHSSAYNTTNDGIMLALDGTTNPTAGHIIVLGYVAVGDDATSPEFT